MNEFETLKNRYLNLYPLDGVQNRDLKEIEKILDIKLPNDFCEIAKFYGGGQIGDISIYSFNIEDKDNILERTNQFRNAISLPNDFIVLAEPDEGIVFMDTQKEPRILWINSIEVDSLITGKFEVKPDTWKTYKAFFVELLEQEEMDKSNKYE